MDADRRPRLTLDLSDPPRPTFVAPSVPTGGAVLTFQLIVSDGQLGSAADTIDVVVKKFSGFELFGSGLGGSGGLAPALAGSGAPAPGALVSIDVSSGLGGAMGLFFIGPRLDLAVPLAGGLLLVSPLVMIPSTLGGSPGAAGAGTGAFSATIPANPVLSGASVSFQAGYFDPGAPLSISLTNGVRMGIG